MPFTTLTEHTTRNVVAIACLKHLMTESFTIPKLPTSDFVSGIMGHGTALSRLWILVLSFLLGYHLQLFSERDVIVFIVRYLFMKAAENCMMAMAV